MFLIVLVLLFLPRLGSAETLLCPILDTPEGADFSRAAALQTTPALYEALATETGRSPTETPWSDETEVTTGRTAANQLRLTIGAWGQLLPSGAPGHPGDGLSSRGGRFWHRGPRTPE